MADPANRPSAAPRRVTVLTPGLAASLLLALIVALVAGMPSDDPAAPPGVLGTHPSAIKALAFAHHGTALAVGGLDGSVDLWDVGSKRGVPVVPPPVKPLT